MGLQERSRGFPAGTTFTLQVDRAVDEFGDFAAASAAFVAAVQANAATVELRARPPGEPPRTIGLFGDCGFAIASAM